MSFLYINDGIGGSRRQGRALFQAPPAVNKPPLLPLPPSPFHHPRVGFLRVVIGIFAYTAGTITSLAAETMVPPVLEDGTVVLANERLRLEFKPVAVEGGTALSPVVSVKRNGAWQRVNTDPGAEQYIVTRYPADLERRLNVGHELYNRTHHGEWQRPGRKERLTSIFDAGEPFVFRPRAVRIEGRAVVLEFPEQAIGRLQARWELAEGLTVPKVELSFVPAQAGHYSLGYRLFWKRDLAQVAELLLPTLFLRRGLPPAPVTMLDPYMSTPLSLVQTRGSPGVTLGVAGDPSEIRLPWPDGHQPRFGLMLRHADGNVQPSISGPVPGTEATSLAARQECRFTFRVFVTDGDWYAGYRTIVDDVFALGDYRQNWKVSLTEAVYNMIDLIKNDRHGGWWPEGKGFYQVESRNTVTQAVPAVLLSVYRLTADEDFFLRRTLPTIEFCLSRNNFHFAPVQLNQRAGGYLRNFDNAMRGPVPGFGATTYGAMWALANRRTQALGNLAQSTRGQKPNTDGLTGWDTDDSPATGPASATNLLATALDAWSARFALTGNPADLTQARRAADLYIDAEIRQASTTVHTGFWHAKLPNWEGLLWLYELTGEPRYLEAAAFGARQLMVGIWTQPTIPDRDRLVAANGEQYRERHDALWLWRGDDRHRLGYVPATGNLPRLLPAPPVPAWLASNIGLGYEGEGSLNDPRAPLARYSFQSVWAPSFLKLARYTGEKAFETYARNAVIGRFANYPGYYLHGPVTLQNDPQYPLKGPDFTYLYYHHIPVHLGWCLDYLVSEAMLRTNAAITFPSLRQTGYAFFNYRVYGHAPGKIFDHSNVWLWFNRQLVTVDEPQLNTLTAHDDRRLFITLMNEDAVARVSTVRASAALLGVPSLAGKTVQVLDATGQVLTTTTCTGAQVAKVEVPARDLRVVVVQEVAPQVATHRVQLPAQPGSGVVMVPTTCAKLEGKKPVLAHGAPIQVLPGRWSAYVWLDASREQVRKATLRYSVDGGRTFQEQHRDQYPYEFTVPSLDASQLEFEITGKDWDGAPFRTTARQTLTPSS